MIWTPHATVATIVEQDNKLLMVEERSYGRCVFNQPAGHVDENESIFEAAERETLEETGWRVQLKSLVGTYIYTAPENSVTYYRFCFAATTVEHVTTELDQDIIGAHWLSRDEIKGKGASLRSPLIQRCIQDYDEREHLPLHYIYEHSFPNFGSA